MPALASPQSPRATSLGVRTRMQPSRCWLAALACAATLAAAATARADGFVFEVDDATIIPGSGDAIIAQQLPALSGLGFGTDLEAQLQPQLTTLVQSLKADVEARLAPLNFSPYLKATANASALSAKAAPVDHATAFRIFSLSLGAGAGISGLGDLVSLKHPSTISTHIENGTAPRFGVAPEASALLGIHLGAFHLPKYKYFDFNRVEVYVNIFRLRLGGGSKSWAVGASNYGAHAKYQILLGRALAPHGLVRWHGLNVITGLSYTGQSLQFHTNLASSTQSQTMTYQGQQLTTTATYSGSAQLRANMSNFTIPLEAATSLELVRVLTVYGGAGLDFNIGRASLGATATAPVNVSVAGPQGGAGTVVSRPTPRLNYALVRRPDPVDIRGFLGLQLGYAVASVFAQIAADSSKTVALHGGLRIFW